jgi:hypothetical protein
MAQCLIDEALAGCYFLVAYLAYALTLKLEVIRYSETSANLYQSTWLHISQYLNLIAACFFLISCLAYSLALAMEAVHCSEIFVNLYQNARRHIPEYCDVHAVRNMASVYNDCHSNRSTVNSASVCFQPLPWQRINTT